METTERMRPPKVARFRQTTHHRPRTTRRDRVQHAARVTAALEG
jgi:hypothetical protein